MTRSKEYLLYNAVLSWLANYGSMGEDLTPQYQQLETELKKNYEQSINPQTRKRGRAAKRQRTQKATSNSSSTKESKTTNQEA